MSFWCERTSFIDLSKCARSKLWDQLVSTLTGKNLSQSALWNSKRKTELLSQTKSDNQIWIAKVKNNFMTLRLSLYGHYPSHRSKKALNQICHQLWDARSENSLRHQDDSVAVKAISTCFLRDNVPLNSWSESHHRSNANLELQTKCPVMSVHGWRFCTGKGRKQKCAVTFEMGNWRSRHIWQ